MGAALLGFSLMGPQTSVAAADSTSESTSASRSPADPKGDDSDVHDADRDSAVGSDTVADADDSDDADDAAPDDADAEADERDEAPGGSGDVTDDQRDEDTDQKAVAAEPNSATARVPTTEKPVASGRDSSPAELTVQAPVPAPKSTSESRAIGDSTNTDLDRATRTRRLFFNQAPTVAPVQITGRVTGPVTGTVGAVDPEGDPLAYRLTRAPREGAVQLNADGTYTYTPDSDFDGVDTFRVLAIDLGPRIKLFRPQGTRADALVNQGAIQFDFNFTDDGTGWTAERQQALQRTATDIVEYLSVASPVTLTYDVGLDEEESNLASAVSDFISHRRGYSRTVVQNKLLSGKDSNGAAADGEIYWNFEYSWALGDAVGADDYDFVSTVMHELLHTFGFSSYVGEPGDNENTTWDVFDSFIVTADGVRPISRRFKWSTDYDPNLVGGDDGLYFGGSNAVAAYGGLVPLFTPEPWESGSSMSHLDDFTFTDADQKVMNAYAPEGLGIRVLSAVELGILKDLGYQVFPQSPTYAAAIIGFVFVRRRVRKSASGAR